MARVCQITGKKPGTGHHVSHSMRHTKRRFLPNLQTKRIFDPATGRMKKMKVSTRAIRNLSKGAIRKSKIKK